MRSLRTTIRELLRARRAFCRTKCAKSIASRTKNELWRVVRAKLSVLATRALCARTFFQLVLSNQQQTTTTTQISQFVGTPITNKPTAAQHNFRTLSALLLLLSSVAVSASLCCICSVCEKPSTLSLRCCKRASLSKYQNNFRNNQHNNQRNQHNPTTNTINTTTIKQPRAVKTKQHN